MLNSIGTYCCPYVPKSSAILIAAVITICIRLWLAVIDILAQNVASVILGSIKWA